MNMITARFLAIGVLLTSIVQLACAQQMVQPNGGIATQGEGNIVASPITVYPTRVDGFTQSLNGIWSFRYFPALAAGSDEEFHKASFDVSAWKTIPVPANWEIQGFAEPHYYMDLQDGLGLYRRRFRVPAAWRGGRRVCLRFDGVVFAFEAWVNGTRVGASSASAFNPTTLDITDALQSDPNADDVLAVRVTTKPIAWQSDVNDDWDLSGIFRDVTLFSVPATYVQDVIARTKLTTDGAADLSVAVMVSRPHGDLHGKLLAPSGETVREFDIPRQPDGHFDGTVHVTERQLWTAETPSLYHLQLSLSAKGQLLQTIDQRIGLREVSIVNGILELNGRPIKLHGVDKHDEAPDVGRAMTEDRWRRDLELMKQGNMNFVRTSHSPPNQRFIELCDEMGIYVLCEVPLAHFQTDQKDNPAYRANIMARVEATIHRDKNHPSVIAWSIGNENKIVDLLWDAGRHAKEIDPTRPICYPAIGTYFDKNYGQLPQFVDLFAPHYPTNAMLREWATTLKRPTILTEYAHSNGLAADRIQDQCEILQATPHFAGGAIWHFMDQGLLETSPKAVELSKSTPYVWLDEHRFYNTHGLDGQDGITYSDRTPQPDYREARKVYSPVQIAERSLAVKPGAQVIALTVDNRYDFRALAGMKLAWSLKRNGTELQRGDLPLHAASHDHDTVSVSITVPADAIDDVLALELRCTDETGRPIIERTVRLDLPQASRIAWLGLFHLNREDLRFQGNRRETELALLTDVDGAGVAMISFSAADVAVERDGDKTLLSHNAVISGLGNKGTHPETIVDAAKTPHIARSFTRFPVGDAWPAALTRWFGKPNAASEVFHPFYYSYDQ